MDIESIDSKIDTQQVKAWVEEAYGQDVVLRDRSFCLALDAITTMPAIVDESNETPDSMIAITMQLANKIHDFLKGESK